MIDNKTYFTSLTKYILSLLVCLISFHSIAQQKDQKLDSIDGVYIPVDLYDCFEQINSFLGDSTKQQVAKLSDEDFAGRSHFGLGLWMRNNWSLWGGSRLSKYFNDLGIHHPDDMSGIILDSYHRQLTGKKIELKKQIKYYQGYWKEAEKRMKKERLEVFKEYNIGDTVDFTYRFDYISEDQEKAYEDDSCIAKGIVKSKNRKTLELQIELLIACDPKGIIISEWETRNKDGEITETGKDIMMEKEVLWTDFELWY
ncbi:MAG: DUF6794 domain-containing protein [Bacteroidota bacterium]